VAAAAAADDDDDDNDDDDDAMTSPSCYYSPSAILHNNTRSQSCHVTSLIMSQRKQEQ